MHVPTGLGDGTQLRERGVIRVATGREEAARRLAEERLQALRAQRRAAGTACAMSLFSSGSRGTWLEYASLAANEDLKDEAVGALQGAMRCGELPPARAERVHLLCEVNAFIVKSLTSCVALGLGSP
jgi:hypothetical protein